MYLSCKGSSESLLSLCCSIKLCYVLAHIYILKKHYRRQFGHNVVTLFVFFKCVFLLFLSDPFDLSHNLGAGLTRKSKLMISVKLGHNMGLDVRNPVLKVCVLVSMAQIL